MTDEECAQLDTELTAQEIWLRSDPAPLKEYKCLIINGYTVDKFLDKSLKELTDEGYQIVPVTIRGDILLFQRNKRND